MITNWAQGQEIKYLTPMELYSLEDATYLMDYYTSKMLGKLMEETTGAIVLRLFIEKYSNDKYKVNGEGTPISNMHPKRSIEKIAITQNLELPQQVLANRNQLK